MIITGKRDVDPTLPSHVPGVHEGNWPVRALTKLHETGRSTGIAPKTHAPIDPRMPKLTPP